MSAAILQPPPLQAQVALPLQVQVQVAQPPPLQRRHLLLQLQPLLQDNGKVIISRGND